MRAYTQTQVNVMMGISHTDSKKKKEGKENNHGFKL